VKAVISQRVVYKKITICLMWLMCGVRLFRMRLNSHRKNAGVVCTRANLPKGRGAKSPAYGETYGGGIAG
jgi:hypothetical protein